MAPADIRQRNGQFAQRKEPFGANQCGLHVSYFESHGIGLPKQWDCALLESLARKCCSDGIRDRRKCCSGGQPGGQRARAQRSSPTQPTLLRRGCRRRAESYGPRRSKNLPPIPSLSAVCQDDKVRETHGACEKGRQLAPPPAQPHEGQLPRRTHRLRRVQHHRRAAEQHGPQGLLRPGGGAAHRQHRRAAGGQARAEPLQVPQHHARPRRHDLHAVQLDLRDQIQRPRPRDLSLETLPLRVLRLRLHHPPQIPRSLQDRAPHQNQGRLDRLPARAGRRACRGGGRLCRGGGRLRGLRRARGWLPQHRRAGR